MIKKEVLIEKIRWFWDEYKRHRLGLLGLGIIIFFVILAILTPVLAPINPREWQNPEFWINNPTEALPIWYNVVSPTKLPEHKILTDYVVEKRTVMGAVTEITITYKFNYDADIPPSDVDLHLIYNYSKAGWYEINVIRPDNTILPLAQREKYEPSRTGNPPYRKELIIPVGRSEICRRAVQNWLYKNNIETNRSALSLMFLKIDVDKGVVSDETIKGTYTLQVKFTIFGEDPAFTVVSSKLVIGGKVYGLLGTDDHRRDLWYGILWGIPVALMIGVLASVISVALGVMYGVVSGYAGGKVDELMMRITDVLMAIPVLPILIALAIVFRPNVLNIIILIALFGWMGISKVARSMALQLKETQFVEAARAVGASAWRIIFRHIAPHILPYAFASLALGIPGAILTEAGLSFLGLGDPTLPTWGTILHDAQVGGAISKGMWWWWLPPGLLIALLSLGFVFVGHAIDEIVNPKLKTL